MKPLLFPCPGVANLAAAVVLWLSAATVAVLAQTDDFNDGNDAGWSHYSPLDLVGAGAAYTYPGGAYRVKAPASPAPDVVGPQRAGSLRPEKTYTRVQLAADIEAWDNTINQSLGLIARVDNLGLGTTTGYTYNYNTFSGFHQLTVVRNESPERQANESFFRVDHQHRYRMVFTLVGSRLLGQMFSATNATVPLHSVFGIDETHTAGTAGVFAFALNAAGPIDARFDNYVAAVPAKVRATLLDSVPAVGERPELPIESVAVRLASVETKIDPASIQLEVDGRPVAFETVEEFEYLRLTHTPTAPLDPATPHTAKVSFRDEDGTQSFNWPFGAPASATVPVLLAADGLGETFQPIASTLGDTGALTIRTTLQGTQRFFRVSDVTARRIVAVTLTGDEVVITFE